MRIFKSTKEYADTSLSSCVALGFFDGVHIGHKDVIKNAVLKKGSLSSVVLTFEKSPAVVLGKTKENLLLSNEKKSEIFEQLCVDSTIFADFNEMLNFSAEEFVEEILDKKLKAEKVFCGFNYHFGKSGKASTDTLKKLCEKRGIEVEICNPVTYEDKTVSSTKIREAIENGNIKTANAMLGYNFSISGAIKKGNKLGHEFKTPTVNIPLKDGFVVPKFGVYKTKVFVDDKTYLGATNVGIHPTVGETSPLCETYLFDYDGLDIYDKNIKVELLSFIREEKKFSSHSELMAQIEKDKKTIQEDKDI